MSGIRDIVRYGVALTIAVVLSACGGGTDTVSDSSQGDRMPTPRLFAPGDITWTQCAVEDGICNVPGTNEVRYGLNGTYATRVVTGSVACTNQVFGDPLPGADKVCEYATIEPGGEPPPPPPPPPPGDTWTKCANEGGVCVFSGTTQVRYGLNGTYAIRTASDSIGCNNQVFGDPLPGIVKICEYATSGSEPPPPPPDLTWTRCASEGGICSFSGTRQVRYGRDTTFVTRIATGSIGCNNEVFGDPLFGIVKVCDYATEGSTTPPSGTVPPVTSGSMTMSCVDGPSWQCSGGSLIRIDNGVGLTRSGVQVYGRSTSDMQNPNPDQTGAFGLTAASGGLAEIRLSKEGGGNIGGMAMILSNLGLTWDGVTERPMTIETFTTTQGRVQLDSSGALVFGALPSSANLGFFDYASQGRNGTQANYANNRYFPRSEPSRCNPPSPSCPTIETTGLHYLPRIGDWRSGGNTPDMMDAGRVHGDGDIHSGDALPGSSPPWLPGGTGYGVPFPGSKGYRAFDGWSYAYSNLAAWITQDTINIGEWGALEEHNKNRRGFVAYGAVTDPAAVPASGAASYAGFAYGWHAPNAVDDPVFINGNATVTVNFATRSATIAIQNTQAGATPMPLAFTATVPMGATGENVANYMTGVASTGALSGGVGGRYFGPVVTGGNGAGPTEVGGIFSMSSASTGQVFIGGFVGRKQ